MAYQSGTLNETIALAAGGDPGLLQELRRAFAQSAERQFDLMQRARCDGNWNLAAMRLKGLAASFHADALIGLADEALDGAPGDPMVLRRIRSFLDQFSGD